MNDYLDELREAIMGRGILSDEVSKFFRSYFNRPHNAKGWLTEVQPYLRLERRNLMLVALILKRNEVEPSLNQVYRELSKSVVMAHNGKTRPLGLSVESLRKIYYLYTREPKQGKASWEGEINKFRELSDADLQDALYWAVKLAEKPRPKPKTKKKVMKKE